MINNFNIECHDLNMKYHLIKVLEGEYNIPVIIEKALKHVPAKKNSTLSSILASDKLTREYTKELINKI